MKPEEAIRILKRYKKSIESDFTKPEETEPVQAYNAAIQSLEKQIAKKPIYQGSQFEEEPTCPSCFRTLDEEVDISGCQMCLQRLDWGNEE